MAEVKWIKLAVGLPDNRKIKQLRKLPDGDTIALMWIFLMCLAGETNEDGFIYFTPEIPYTEEMLADQFSMDINTVRLGLSTFRKFGMLEIIDDIIKLDSWDKWQATDKLAEIREYNRIKQRESRARKKLLSQGVIDKSLTSQPCQDTDIDIDKEKEKEEELREDKKKKNNKKEEDPLNSYGKYNNVFLSDEDYTKLQLEFPEDYKSRIENLSSYMASTGKKYENHLATIEVWASNEKKTSKRQRKSGLNNYNENRELTEFEKRMIEKRMNPPATAGTDENIQRKVDEIKKRLDL